MRKFVVVMLLSILPGCNAEKKSGEKTEAVQKAPENARAVLDALKANRLDMTDVSDVTEASDDNHLLGRPGQYTSKLFFYDRRHPKSGDSDEGENTIEVFASAADAKARRDYIDGITKGVAFLAQYELLRGNALVRLDKILLPSEAKEYERALAASIPE